MLSSIVMFGPPLLLQLTDTGPARPTRGVRRMSTGRTGTPVSLGAAGSPLINGHPRFPATASLAALIDSFSDPMVARTAVGS
ncbi:hypothetical protein HOK021_48630 [Streptomyces hygroscopicus]|nr:hypothetical protein HOK021_48630 [Streptomyces hygroscopicus]